MKDTIKVRSILYSFLIFILVTVLNIIPIILTTIFLAGFNDSDATFSVIEGIMWSIEMMLFPLLFLSPVYLVGYWIAIRFYEPFHKSVYFISVVFVFLAIFSFYLYLTIYVY